MPRHANSGSFKPKYFTPEDRAAAKRIWSARSYAKHKTATIHKTWIRQLKQLGFTQDLYEQFWAMQRGVCAICKRFDKKRLSADHCHKMMLGRGLLCNKCNRVLGLINDDPFLAAAIVRYLCPQVP